MKMVRVALLVVLLSLASGAPLAAPPPGEYQIKAAYLLNFARYVEWPAARLVILLCSVTVPVNSA